MKKNICRKCIDKWAEENNRPEWSWNHTVFDDSFWSDRKVNCPFSGSRTTSFKFQHNPPEHCEYKEDHKGK
jgi:hypothetical protein